MDSPIVDDTYILRDASQPQTWPYSDIFTIATQVDCGLITVEFFNQDVSETVLDPLLFNDTRDPSNINTFTILQTQDVTKKGTYPISYRAYHTSYASNVQVKTTAFTMTLIDPCDIPVSVTASVLAN